MQGGLVRQERIVACFVTRAEVCRDGIRLTICHEAFGPGH
jgi:hypothetical protein